MSQKTVAEHRKTLKRLQGELHQAIRRNADEDIDRIWEAAEKAVVSMRTDGSFDWVHEAKEIRDYLFRVEFYDAVADLYWKDIAERCWQYQLKKACE